MIHALSSSVADARSAGVEGSKWCFAELCGVAFAGIRKGWSAVMALSTEALCPFRPLATSAGATSGTSVASSRHSTQKGTFMAHRSIRGTRLRTTIASKGRSLHWSSPYLAGLLLCAGGCEHKQTETRGSYLQPGAPGAGGSLGSGSASAGNSATGTGNPPRDNEARAAAASDTQASGAASITRQARTEPAVPVAAAVALIERGDGERCRPGTATQWLGHGVSFQSRLSSRQNPDRCPIPGCAPRSVLARCASQSAWHTPG